MSAIQPHSQIALSKKRVRAVCDYISQRMLCFSCRTTGYALLDQIISSAKFKRWKIEWLIGIKLWRAYKAQNILLES